MLKCIVFDLDGTLIDTIKDLAVATNIALKKNGCNEHDVNAYYDFVGSGIKTLCERALNKLGKYNDELLEKVFKDFKEYYDVNFNVYTKPYEGIVELVKFLKSSNYVVGVFSNKVEHLAKIVVELNFGSGLFDFVLGESPKYNKKPDATQLLDLLKDKSIDVSECLYIGDSDVDMMTAKNANITAVAVTWGFRSKEILSSYNPKFIVDIPKQINDIVLNWR